jgi:hypothetical protein
LAFYGTATGTIGTLMPMDDGNLVSSTVFSFNDHEHAVVYIRPLEPKGPLVLVLRGSKSMLLDLERPDLDARWRTILSARHVGNPACHGDAVIIPVDDSLVWWRRGEGLEPHGYRFTEDVRAVMPLERSILSVCGRALHLVDPDPDEPAITHPLNHGVADLVTGWGDNALVTVHETMRGKSVLVAVDGEGPRALSRLDERITAVWPSGTEAIIGTEGGGVFTTDLETGELESHGRLDGPVLHAAPDPYVGDSLIFGLREVAVRTSSVGFETVHLDTGPYQVHRPVTAYWSERRRSSDSNLREIVHSSLNIR